MGEIVAFGGFPGCWVGKVGIFGGAPTDHGVFYLFGGIPAPGFRQMNGSFYPRHVHFQENILVCYTFQGIPGIQISTHLQCLVGLIGNLVSHYFQHVTEFSFEAVKQVVLHNSLQK